MFDYGYGYSSSFEGAIIWMIIAAVLAVIGGFVVYFLFLTPKNENKFKGFAKWLYEFLSFKKMFAEVMLRIAYLITAIYITLSSFALITESFLAFILMLTLGNVLARVAYEYLLLFLVICKNTTEINKKLK